MEKAISLNIKGLKCDAEGCDYKNNTIKVEEYPDWVNAPCPECGANLLTEADYKATQELMKMADLINLGALLSPHSFEPNQEETVARVKVEMNGTGNVTFKGIDKE